MSGGWHRSGLEYKECTGTVHEMYGTTFAKGRPLWGSREIFEASNAGRGSRRSSGLKTRGPRLSQGIDPRIRSEGLSGTQRQYRLPARAGVRWATPGRRRGRASRGAFLSGATRPEPLSLPAVQTRRDAGECTPSPAACRARNPGRGYSEEAARRKALRAARIPALLSSSPAVVSSLEAARSISACSCAVRRIVILWERRSCSGSSGRPGLPCAMRGG